MSRMEWTTETVLMQRAIRRAVSRSKFEAPLWVIVMEIFAVGKEHAAVICKHYGFNPEEKRHNWAFYKYENDGKFDRANWEAEKERIALINKLTDEHLLMQIDSRTNKY